MPTHRAHPHADTPGTADARHVREAPRRATPAWLVQAPGRSIAAVALLAAIALGVVSGLFGLSGGTTDDRTSGLPRGYDSTAVAEQLPALTDADTDTAVVVIARELDGDGLTDADLAWLGDLAQGWGEEDGVTVLAPRPTVADDRTLAVLPVQIDTDRADPAEVVDSLRADLDGTDRPAGLEAGVTGPAAIQTDIAQVFEGADLTLLLATASVVALLLILTYRSPVLWLIPLVVVAIADRTAAIVGSEIVQSLGLPFDPSSQGILSVLVFGAGTDYALLLIARYREELARHESRRVAMTRAVRGVTEAVLCSAGTVVLALLVLLLSVVPTTQGLGLSSAAGIVIAAVSGLVVLPGVLVLFGRWVFWPRIPHADPAAAGGGARGLWGRVGGAVVRRPRRVLAIALLGLVALAIGTGFLRVGLSSNEVFLDTPESVTVADRLGESFPAGASQPVTVLAPSADLERALRVAGQVDGVASVAPGAADDTKASVQVVLADAPGTDAADATIERLRSALADVGPDVLVGGTQAQDLDAASAADRDLRWVLPLVLLAVGLVLLGLLRSIVASLVLLASVLLTWASAVGAAWWLFTGPLGMSALDTSVPLYSFLFLVALGVDFSIFLVTRAREEAASHGTVDGMVRGLARTGGVITSAGVLLAAVFLTLGVLPVIALAQIGTIVCLGVLLDTLVVRTLVVPAATAVLGDRFWWPSERSARDEGARA
ncbi:MMPL family transporter [Nocardioides sp. R-C-SC26]|uniref:MMPL family transporter n=1 Tax=Nocardioides sp. R-C-SC26 TaxID=2870414 RepID=UPI001E4CAC27|nr:MMPL family transporter [Nocardioides sp. R-C-SC26]